MEQVVRVCKKISSLVVRTARDLEGKVKGTGKKGLDAFQVDSVTAVGIVWGGALEVLSRQPQKASCWGTVTNWPPSMTVCGMMELGELQVSAPPSLPIRDWLYLQGNQVSG